MTNKKSTKRALICSALALVLCFSMLVGTTFAWFTDSVSSANNIIASGNLDVNLYYMAEGQTDWTAVTNTTNIFKENALWEPGHTEVVKFKVVNEGSLALKYQLGVNVASETPFTNVNGDTVMLSQFIKYAVIDGAQSYTRDEAVAAAEDAGATALAFSYNTEYITLDSTAEKIVTMVVYMPTTVGNEANHAKDEAPEINLGINVVATQVENEEDAFGNDYDTNAPFSVWDGTVPAEMPASLVVDGATKTVHVKDAAAFAYLSTLSAQWRTLYTDGKGTTHTNYVNGAGGNYYYSGQWAISLEADIDLNNQSIAPVTISFGESTGASAFNGNGHTIRNINTTTGLFADNTRASFSNLTLENVKATNGALIGTANNDISNVTVKNATISGVDYVGGLVGYTYGAINGCKVIDSSVVATGKEAGGLAGYVATSRTEATVAYNTVNNVNVYAGNRAAGLIAQVNVDVKVYNNIIDNVTVGAADTSNYQPGAVVSNALAPENVYDNTVTNANVATKAALVNDAAGLKEAAKNNDVVYAEGVVVEGSTQLNTGATIIGATFKNENGTAVTQTISGTFKDCVFEGSETLRWCYSKAGETVVFENCVIKTDLRGVHFDDMAGNVIFKNCEINGFNAIGGEGTVTFENCTFGNDRSSYNGLNMYSNINLIDCTFNFVSGNTNFIDMEGVGKTLKIVNCKATLDGEVTDIAKFVGGSKLDQNTVVIE